MTAKMKMLLVIVGMALLLVFIAAPALAIGDAGGIHGGIFGSTGDTGEPGNSSAAHNCPHGSGGEHGDCVSDAAQSGAGGGVQCKWSNGGAQ